MRMNQQDTFTAKELLQTYSEKELARIFYEYGEEKWAARIAKILVEKRNIKPLETTQDLVDVVDAAIPKAVRKKEDGHPARRVFQAVRIALNDELDPLAQALQDCVASLHNGGRLCVITFHSLEDRIVKQTFRKMENPCVCPPKSPICTCGKISLGKVLARGAVKPTQEEIQKNTRARSALLRIFEKK
ncbi:MAG: 16S rRNA (cytosine(1402)-N(4))-methyltransferase RsmH, partial [Clostridiales bacterium]|nr:16S rRNA (cytosine(1402)-N(4))-methyltransferase RsmH [Clostridiales bacterium]